MRKGDAAETITAEPLEGNDTEATTLATDSNLKMTEAQQIEMLRAARSILDPGRPATLRAGDGVSSQVKVRINVRRHSAPQSDAGKSPAILGAAEGDSEKVTSKTKGTKRKRKTPKRLAWCKVGKTTSGSHMPAQTT